MLPTFRSGWLARHRAYALEATSLAFLGAVVALFLARGVPFTVGPLLGYYGLFLGAIAALALAPYAVVQWVRWRRGERSGRALAADLGGLTRGLLVLIVVLVAYTNLKSRIFLFHPTLYDRELARLDDLLHFAGGDFRTWLLSTTWNSLRMGLLDLAYFYAWVPLALPFAVAFAARGAPVARRLLGALALSYIGGGLLYLALPSVGPAFFERERFSHLADFQGFQIQEMMLADLRQVTARPNAPAVAFFGVAAFPSLHLASTALGCFAAWRWCRPLTLLLVPLNLVIAWSALVWGWHYAVDFYAGLLLAWGAWRLMGRWVVEESPARLSKSATGVA